MSIAVLAAILFATFRICLSSPHQNPLSLQPLQVRPHAAKNLIEPSGAVLKTIRGGHHKNYDSVVFQFSDRVSFDEPVIETGELHFDLKKVSTTLSPFRRYKTFDSWVRLETAKDGLTVRMGLPESCSKVNTFQLQKPHRLVVNMYHHPSDTPVQPPSTPLGLKVSQVASPPSGPPMPEASAGQKNITQNDMEGRSEEIAVQEPGPPDASIPAGVGGSGQAVAMGTAGGGITSPTQRYRVKLTPKISIKGEYDDNIFLEKTDKKGDFITTISPGIILDLDSGRNGLELEYTFGRVRYNDLSENDFIRHSGRLKLWQRLSRHLTLNVSDTYLKSDDLFDEDLAPDLRPQRVRHIRTPYQRNDFNTSLDYDFGRESRLSVGYRHAFLDNEDPSLEDVTEHSPYAGLTYWFNKKDGIVLDYEYRRFDYSVDPEFTLGRVDLDAHDVDVTYMHRFSRRSKVYIHYGFANRNFHGTPVSYHVHDGDVGFEYGFSRTTSLSLEMGYFDPTGIDIDGGLSYTGRLEKRFRRGVIFVAVRSGWDEGFMDVEPRAFTRYRGGDAGIEYEPVHNLRAYAGVSYRKNEYALQEYEDEHAYTGRCGVKYRFLRWFSADFGYAHRRRVSDDPNNEYRDNRVTVTFSASKPHPYTWEF
ncbi:MAG: outer membrane beta-barrel protein [Desulfatiglandaceae bacterium]